MFQASFPCILLSVLVASEECDFHRKPSRCCLKPCHNHLTTKRSVAVERHFPIFFVLHSSLWGSSLQNLQNSPGRSRGGAAKFPFHLAMSVFTSNAFPSSPAHFHGSSSCDRLSRRKPHAEERKSWVSGCNSLSTAQKMRRDGPSLEQIHMPDLVRLKSRPFST